MNQLISLKSQLGFFRVKGSQPVNIEYLSRETMYIQLYFQLKGQKTVLIQLHNLLIEEMEKDESKKTKKIKKKISNLVEEVLNFTYFNLILDIEEKTVELNNLVHKLPNAKDLSVSEKILKAFLALNRVSKRFVVARTKETTSPPEEIGHKDEIPDDDTSMVVCRICGEKIPENLVEEHTEVCIAAFKNESRLEQIKKRLDSAEESFSNSGLDTVWPGEEKIAENILFPKLSCFTLIIKAKSIKPDDPGAAEELAQIAIAAKSLGANDICVLALEKRRYCIAFAAAAEQLHKTTSTHVVPKQPAIDEFTFIKRISGGAYARVFLARKTNTKDIFAVKVLKRRDVMTKNLVQQVITERDILLGCVSPYIVSFFYSIPGKNNLYLFMEYLPGGDMFSLLQVVGGFDEDCARVYTKQIIKALKFLHERGIIHRDLKPDNILIAADGTLKLTDFGLSYAGAVGRHVNAEDKIVGTADYVAPEVVMCLPNGPCADYWSLGCIVYEMVCGVPPFHRDSEAETFDAILKGYYEPLEDVSPQCIDFVSKLLNIDYTQRLGANGIQEILDHPWVNMEGDDSPPFIPTLSSPIDTDYFQTRYKFSVDDEKDIIEDIELAKKIRHSKKIKLYPPSIHNEYLNDFTKVSVEHLRLANAEAANRLRRSRAGSDALVLSSPTKVPPSPTKTPHIISRSPAPFATSRERNDRPMSANVRIRASDDFLLHKKRKDSH